MLESARKVADPPELFSSVRAWLCIPSTRRDTDSGVLSVLWGTVTVLEESQWRQSWCLLVQATR